MPTAEEVQQDLMEFERSRNQLLNIGSQKQQLSMQSSVMQSAIDELAKTKEKKVYKAVGNIMLLADVDDVKKELKEQKETVELRVKTLQKQEDSLVAKLNKLKAKIEAFDKGLDTAQVTKSESSDKASK